jgi:hypothetical protein
MTSETVPTGGTTGHSHERSAAIEQAAIWFADQKEPPRPAVPALRERFGLSMLEATEALAMAQRFRINRRAFG